MSDPPQGDAPQQGAVLGMTHEWIYLDAPSGKRQCRYCLAYETNISQMQEIGLCPRRVQEWQVDMQRAAALLGRPAASFPEVGAAYVAGVVARRNWVPKGHHGDPNPYHHATQPWLAWRSGWNDQGVWLARGPAREQDG